MSQTTKAGRTRAKYEATQPATSYEGLPVMLSVAQAAELGGWSRKHVLNMLHKGVLKGIRLGTSWRISRDYFLLFLGLQEA